MVVISIKSGGQDGFLYEASVQDMNEDLIAGLVSDSALIAGKIHQRVHQQKNEKKWKKVIFSKLQNVYKIPPLLYFLKVRVWNMRIRMNMLIGAMRDLAKYGPMKPKEDQGIDSVKTLRHFNCWCQCLLFSVMLSKKTATVNISLLPYMLFCKSPCEDCVCSFFSHPNKQQQFSDKGTVWGGCHRKEHSL